MTSFSIRAPLLGIAMGCVLVGWAGAAEALEGPSAAVRAPSTAGALESTGQYRGYAGRVLSLWIDDGKRMRFHVDDRSVPDWRKRFRFGERITVTYRDLGSRRLPLVIGLRKAEAEARKD